jgi:hypothetical protein
LSFDVDGNQIFTAGPVSVPNPGGRDVQGDQKVQKYLKEQVTRLIKDLKL